MTIPQEVADDLLAAAHMFGVVDGYVLLDGQPVCLQPTGDYRGALPALAAALYTRWFADWRPSAAAEGPAFPSVSMQVRAVHAGTRSLEGGWRAARQLPRGFAVAIRGQEQYCAEPGDYVNLSHPGVPVKAGDAMAIARRRDAGEGTDGWWQTWGAAGPAPERRMLRVYWHCGAEMVVELVRQVTGVLVGADVPYTLKCPSASELFGRRDAVVLYFSPEVWAAVKAKLRRVHENLADQLGEATPPLTLRLGRGAAFAEDPENGHSFGSTMAWAVADGLFAALAAGNGQDEEVLETMTRRLAARGISPQQPYRRPGSGTGPGTPW